MTRRDPYPSRVGGAAQLLPRVDPVVHPGRDGPLSTAALASYEQQGFLHFDALLERQELDHLIRDTQRLLEERRHDDAPELIREPGDAEIRSIFAVHEHEAAFRALVRHPRLLGIAEQLLGSAVYVHQSRINCKPAFRGQPFHWHSDFETWHVEDGMPRMRALSFSISLCENRPDNGPLMVVPESHRRFISCPGETPERHYERSLQRQEAGVPPEPVVAELACAHGINSPTGPIGSVTIFDCNLLHGSNGNITPFARTNVFLVYNSVENALEAPFSGQPPRPPHVAVRDAVPLP